MHKCVQPQKVRIPHWEPSCELAKCEQREERDGGIKTWGYGNARWRREHAAVPLSDYTSQERSRSQQVTHLFFFRCNVTFTYSSVQATYIAWDASYDVFFLPTKGNNYRVNPWLFCCQCRSIRETELELEVWHLIRAKQKSKTLKVSQVIDPNGDHFHGVIGQLNV